ncbi:MAG: hypothetical protein ACK5MY_04545 [Jhaorihella sp.]
MEDTHNRFAIFLTERGFGLQWSARTTPPSLRFGVTVLTMNPAPMPSA